MSCFSAIIFLSACSYTKNLAEGEYALEKVSIKSDDKKISTEDLADFIVQKPNSTFLTSFLGIMRPRVAIYNWAGKDSTFFDKVWRKIGSPPTIYNEANSRYSAQQLQQQLFNWGYLNASVDFETEKSEKKRTSRTVYHLHPGTPYKIRDFKLDIQDTSQHRVVERALRQNPIRPNSTFNQDELEARLADISSALRNRGYFTFGPEYLQYQADTALNNHEVNVSLNILPRKIERDSGVVILEAHKPYQINQLNIYSGQTTSRQGRRNQYIQTDTTKNKNTFIHYDRHLFLNERTLLERSYVRPGRAYNERLVDLTHQALSSLACVRQVSMDFAEKPGDLLDCNIHVVQGNVHWAQATLEGTNSAGDLGVASSIGYQHRNIFNGAEIFRVRLRGAYEAITGNRPTDLLDQNYYEYGFETGLSFPRFLVKIPKLRERQGSTDIKFSINNQLRAEYKRVFFNAGVAYKWVTARNKLNHTWDIFDLNYVAMPEVSKIFQDSIMNNPNNSILRYSYEDQFILRTSYGFIYNMPKRNQKANEYQTLRANIEFAGNLLYGISKLRKLEKDESNRYKLFNNPFAQYIKIDIDFAKSVSLNRRSALVLHGGLGVACPYLNSVVLPYEKRYFSGGANSLRGWNTRQLGPGIYNNKGVTDFMNQSGDIKFDINVEFRHNIGGGAFQFATFYDAGNIWTMKDYANQPGGQFKWNSFYNEIAMSTGIGFRLDFNFFLIRLDAGLKVFDPSETELSRWRITKPDFNKDFALHFAIGYPF